MAVLVSVSLTGGVLDAPAEGVSERSDFANYELGKRVFDIIFAGTLLVILSPMFAITAILVWASSPGPIIFCQPRLTKDARKFTIYKFRTMVANAEALTGAVWAEKNDSRITRVGSFLRKTRVDELPQLVNVLLGDMSIVGPRPERPEIALLLSNELLAFKRRTTVKAGITGLAQVSSGYASTVDEYRKKLALDILYVNNRSMRLDIQILAKTVLVVLTGSGAR